MDEKYLAAGKQDFLYHITNGYAVVLSSDSTTILYSKAAEKDGVYSKDGPVDEEITKAYRAKLDRPVTFGTSNMTVGKVVDSIISAVSKTDSLKPILDLPKTNKVVMDGLDKALEVMAFENNADNIRFVAFGARPSIVLYLAEKGVYISPAKFYAASAFKSDKVGRFTKYGMIIASKDLEYVSVILSIDMQKRDEARNELSATQTQEL